MIMAENLNISVFTNASFSKKFQPFVPYLSDDDEPSRADSSESVFYSMQNKNHNKRSDFPSQNNEKINYKPSLLKRPISFSEHNKNLIPKPLALISKTKNLKPRLLHRYKKRSGRTKRPKFFVSHTVDKNGFRIAKPLSQKDKLEIYRHHHRQRKHTDLKKIQRNRIWRLRRSRRYSGQLPVSLVQESLKPKFITVEKVQALVNIIDVVKGDPSCLNFSQPSLTSQRNSVHPGTKVRIFNITQIASCKSLLLKDDTKIFYLRVPKSHPCGNQSRESKLLATESTTLETEEEQQEPVIDRKSPQSVLSAPMVPFKPVTVNRNKKQRAWHVADAIPDNMNIENMEYILSRSYDNYDTVMALARNNNN